MEKPLELVVPLRWIDDDEEIDGLLAEVEEVPAPEDLPFRLPYLHLVPPLSGLVLALALGNVLAAAA